MSDPRHTICAVNLAERSALTNSGEKLTVTGMYDCEGEDTTLVEEAVTFVAGPTSDDRWLTDRVDSFVNERQ